MLPGYFIFVAVFLRLFGGLAYLRATLTGKAQPHPLSWLLWGATPMIAFAAELRAEVGLPALVTLSLGISPLAVFLAAIYKRPHAMRLDKFNGLCAILAVLGIVLWRVTDNPNLAILLAIFADTISALPTLRKIRHYPYSEYVPSYSISVVSMVITLLTVTNWTFATYAFPVYVLSINIIIVGFIFYSRVLNRRQRRLRYRAKRRNAHSKRLKARRA